MRGREVLSVGPVMLSDVLESDKGHDVVSLEVWKERVQTCSRAKLLPISEERAGVQMRLTF